MSNCDQRKIELVNRIKDCLRQKFQNYKPETVNMPFHYRLLGKDRMALYSFIQSLNTTFGTSIYEPVAKELARVVLKLPKFTLIRRLLSHPLHIKNPGIIDKITTAEQDPNSLDEMKQISSVCKDGTPNVVRLRKYDVYLKSSSGKKYCIDIKTVKPNIGGVEDHKRMLLSWAASEMYQDPEVDIQPIIGIPYNPYEPEPYNRWTMRGIFDLSHEVKVANDLWDFIGGEGSYNLLLDSFEQAGIELRPEIDMYFKKFL